MTTQESPKMLNFETNAMFGLNNAVNVYNERLQIVIGYQAKYLFNFTHIISLQMQSDQQKHQKIIFSDESLTAKEVFDLLMVMQTDRVKQAQQHLAKHATNTVFWKILVDFMKDQSLQQTVKQISSTTLNSTFVQLLGLLEQESNAQLMNKIFAAIEQLLLQRGISSLLKRNFEKTIIAALESSEQTQLKGWEDMIEKLFSVGNFNIAYLIIACYGCSQIGEQYIFCMVRRYYELSLANLPFSSGSIQAENIVDLNQLLKTWVVIYTNLLDIQGKEAEYLLVDMIHCKKMIQLIDFVFNYQAQNGSFVCTKVELYELNIMKFEAAQLFNTALRFALRIQIAGGNLFQYIQSILPKITDTLNQYAKNQDSMDNFDCESFVLELIKILTNYLAKFKKQREQNQLEKKNPNYKVDVLKQRFIVKYWKLILNQIAFPLIKANYIEIDIFQTEFQQFNALIQDFSDQHQFPSIKSQMANLIEKLGQAIPNQEPIKYCIQYAVESLQFQLLQPNQQRKLTKQQVQKILPIQACFSLLSLYSYRLEKYPDLLSRIKKICDIQQSTKPFYELPPMQQARLFQFLAYNYGQIYKNPQQGVGHIKKALASQDFYTTFLCGLDFISNIAQDFYSEDFIRMICDKVTVIQHSILWTILTKILRGRFEEMNIQAIIYLINKIFKRIEIDTNEIQVKNKKDTLGIINALQTLRKILQLSGERAFSEETEIIMIRETIWNIVKYFQTAKKLDIQDEVVSIISQFIKQCNAINEYQISLLPELMQAFSAASYTGKSYFIVFNQYIMKGNTKDVMPILRLLIEGYEFHNLNVPNKKTKSSKQKIGISIAHHLLLLQNFLAMHGTKIQEDNVFNKIIAQCCKVFPNKEGKVADKALLSRSLNVIFLCYMHNKDLQSLEAVSKVHRVKCYQRYDSKVLVQCIEKQIFERQTDPTVITQLLNIAVRVAQHARKFKQKDVSDKKKFVKGKETKSLKTNIKKRDQYQAILKKIDVPFDKQSSQIDRIKRVIETMKSNNSQLYAVIIQKLDEDVKQIVMQFKKIKAINQSGKQRKIFKIAGIKQSKEEETTSKHTDQMNQLSQDNEAESYKRKRVKQKKIKY